jgi:hypothetical protein
MQASERERYRDLPFDAMALLAKLCCQNSFVDAFEQTGSEISMHSRSNIDNIRSD